MISASHFARHSAHQLECAGNGSVVVALWFSFFGYLHFFTFAVLCIALLHLKINTCVCCLTRRHFLRPPYITQFTHNLQKLIGKRREMKTFTMSHRGATRSHYGNFKIRGTFDPTVLRLEKGTLKHANTNEDNHASAAQTTRITSICYCINLNLILNTAVPSSNGIFFGRKCRTCFGAFATFWMFICAIWVSIYINTHHTKQFHEARDIAEPAHAIALFQPMMTTTTTIRLQKLKNGTLLRIRCATRDCARLHVCMNLYTLRNTQHSRMNSFVSFKKLCKFSRLKQLHAKNTAISGDVQPCKCSPFEWILPLPVDICYLCWNNANVNLLYRTWRNLIFYTFSPFFQSLPLLMECV